MEDEESMMIDRSMLDTQILISLQLVELSIYKLSITERIDLASTLVAEELKAGKWESFFDLFDLI